MTTDTLQSNIDIDSPPQDAKEFEELLLEFLHDFRQRVSPLQVLSPEHRLDRVERTRIHSLNTEILSANGPISTRINFPGKERDSEFLDFLARQVDGDHPTALRVQGLEAGGIHLASNYPQGSRTELPRLEEFIPGLARTEYDGTRPDFRTNVFSDGRSEVVAARQFRLGELPTVVIRQLCPEDYQTSIGGFAAAAARCYFQSSGHMKF